MNLYFLIKLMKRLAFVVCMKLDALMKFPPHSGHPHHDFKDLALRVMLGTYVLSDEDEAFL